jgi:putative ABC transport system permease protein
VVRGDLLGAWQAQIPANAPNFFAINIQPAEVAALTQFFEAQHIEGAGFYAMNRARLSQVNGQAVDVSALHGQAKNLAEREFNLSTQPTKLAPDNTLIEGQWQPAQTGWSVEQGIAKTLHWRLGDRLTFTVNGTAITAPITSLRKVNWDSMRPNFFVLGSPALLAQSPAQFVTSFYLPAPNLSQQKALLQQFPTLTLFDLSQILSEVRTLIQRASQAVQYVFIFTLLAGLVVLLAAFHASEAERLRETAILRVLGASRRQVTRSLWLEFIVLGLLAGGLAALASGLLGALLAVKMFNLPWVLDARLWLYGLAAGLALAVVLVPLLSRRVLASPPAAALRGG